MTVNTNNGHIPKGGGQPAADVQAEVEGRTQTTFQLGDAELARVHTLLMQRRARVGGVRHVHRAEILRQVVAAGLDVLERRETEMAIDRAESDRWSGLGASDH